MLQAKLKVVGGKHHGKIIPLSTHKFLIGREQDCQLRPNSELVSRHHCVFNLDDFTVRLRDLGSTNGTLVNGTRVRGEVTLKSGDRVRVGKLDFEVVIPDPSAPEPAKDDSSRTLPDSRTELAETTQLSSSETSFEIPLPADLPDTGSSVHPMTGDTTVIGPLPTPAGAEAGNMAPPPLPYSHDPYQQQMPYPQQQMPYPQQGYPWMQPVPQYQMPGMHYPQYGMPYQPGMYPGQMGMYPQTSSSPAYPQQQVTQTPSDEMPIIPVRLPDPGSTGVRLNPEPPADEKEKDKKKPEEAKDDKAAPQAKPSEKAADIIKSYMHRRPSV